MKRSSLWSFVMAGLVLAGCGPAEIVITTEVESEDPETGELMARPLPDLEVQLVPFDRNAIFDSLAAAAPEPEPELPAHLIDARDNIADAQERWREAEIEWQEARDRLEEINAEMEQYSPAETRYRELFMEFNDVEDAMVAAENRRDEAFSEFTTLQDEAFEELEEFRLRLEAWEDVAYADYGEVVAQKLSEQRRDIVVDTTDANGRVRMHPDTGDWWVHTRYRLPFDELYWNVPVALERGEPHELRLVEENAEIRPIF